MTDATTSAADAEFIRANTAYDAAGAWAQSKMRFLNAIIVITSSGATHEQRIDALMEAIKAYTADTIIETCAKLQEGMNQGMSISTGLLVFQSVSRMAAMESCDRLIKMIEAFPAPVKKES